MGGFEEIPLPAAEGRALGADEGAVWLRGRPRLLYKCSFLSLCVLIPQKSWKNHVFSDSTTNIQRATVVLLWSHPPPPPALSRPSGVALQPQAGLLPSKTQWPRPLCTVLDVFRDIKRETGITTSRTEGNFSFYLHNWARCEDFGFNIGLAGRATDGREEAHGIFGRDRLSSTRLPAHDDGLVFLVPMAAEKKTFHKSTSPLVDKTFTSHHHPPSSFASASLALKIVMPLS